MAIQPRVLDAGQQIADLERRVDELERLGASRWGVADPLAVRLVSFQQGVSPNLAYPNNAGALVVVYTLPAYTYDPTHRYELMWSWRAASSSTYWQMWRDGANVVSWDFYHDVPVTSGVNWLGGMGTLSVSDSGLGGLAVGGSHSFTLRVRSQAGAGGNLYADDPLWAGIFDFGAP